MKEAHLYKCYYSELNSDGYRVNGYRAIIASGVIRAAEVCKELQPLATIWNVQHCGKVEYIDPDILA